MRAYFDESGKHAAATVISIFGLLMSAGTCKELQRRWFQEASKHPAIPLPFHMSDRASAVNGIGLYRAKPSVPDSSTFYLSFIQDRKPSNGLPDPPR
jgi:hypothetical protein